MTEHEEARVSSTPEERRLAELLQLHEVDVDDPCDVCFLLALLASKEAQLLKTEQERDEALEDAEHFRRAFKTENKLHAATERLMRRVAAEVDVLTEGQMERNARISDLERELERLRGGLERIASMPTSERNPDGDEQAAHSMQLVAQETLALSVDTQREDG